MIRVLHVISGLELGGAEIMLTNLVSRSNRSRFSHTVVSLTTKGEVGAQIEAAGVRVISLDMKRHRPNLSALLKLVGILRRERPDVLQTWLYHADFVGTVAGFCARSPRIAWNVQCSALAETSWLLRGALKTLAFVSRLPQAVVVNSRAGYEAHRRLGYKPRAWVKISNGVDTETFRPRPAEKQALRAMVGIPPEAFAIGLIARFHPMKDHRTFFAAARHFAAKRGDAVFVLAGTGTDPGGEKLLQMASAAGMEGRVVLLGPRGDLANVYPALDLVTLSSAYGEGCPNVLLEAMACGVPCVATNVGDCADIIRETGLIIEPRDALALSDAWSQMARRDLVQLAVAARSRSERFFALDRIVERYDEFYTQLFAGTFPSTGSFADDAETLVI